MSRPRYSILPLLNEQGIYVYLFRDNDLTRNTNEGVINYGVACHYDCYSHNWTKTADPAVAIEMCAKLNANEEKRVKEISHNQITPLRTGSGWGFWPFNR